jgi:hypothetical protein
MAEEMKTTYAWRKALTDSGYNEDATPMNLEFPMSSWLLKDKRGAMAKLFFFIPFLILWSMTMIASHMVIFAGLPISLFVGYSLQWICQQVLPYAPSDMRHIHKTVWYPSTSHGCGGALTLSIALACRHLLGYIILRRSSVANHHAAWYAISYYWTIHIAD